MLNRLERFEEAVSSYDFAVAIDPGFTSAWYNRGNALANLNDPQGAAESYLSVLEHEDGDAATYYNLGLAYDELSDYATAVDYFRRAVADEPDYADAWYGLGCRARRAEPVRRRARQLRPRAPRSSPTRASTGTPAPTPSTTPAVSPSRSSRTSASSRWTRDNKDAWMDLAETRLEAGLRDEALDAFGQVVRLDPTSSEAHLRQAWALASLGQRESAVRSFRRAAELDPSRADEMQRAYPDLWGDARRGRADER